MIKKKIKVGKKEIEVTSISYEEFLGKKEEEEIIPTEKSK